MAKLQVKRGPERLTIKGYPCQRFGEQMTLDIHGQPAGHWDTYQPIDESLDALFERRVEDGRILQTRG